MDEHLRRRLANLRLMRVVRRRDEYWVEQLDPETGAIGVVPGPNCKTWQDAERYRLGWAGFDVDTEQIWDETEELAET